MQLHLLTRSWEKLRVIIKYFASLRTKRPKMEERDLPEGTTILDILTLLNLKSSDVAIVSVNGKAVTDDYVVKDLDRVGLFPPMGGG